MTIAELIDKAAAAAGEQRLLAAKMGKHPSRLSEWKSGRTKPDASEIAFLATEAGLPVLQTVADIEQQLDSRYAEIWRNALGKLTAAGVAATTAGMMVAASPSPANAAPSQVGNGPLYIMSTVRRRKTIGQMADTLFGKLRQMLNGQTRQPC